MVVGPAFNVTDILFFWPYFRRWGHKVYFFLVKPEVWLESEYTVASLPLYLLSFSLELCPLV